MRIISHQTEIPNTDIGIIKKELNRNSGVKKHNNWNNKLIRRAQYKIWVGGRTIELDNRLIEIIQSKAQEKKKEGRKMNRASETCETLNTLTYT